MKKFSIIISVFFVLIFLYQTSVFGEEKDHIQLRCVAEMEIEVINDMGEKEIKRVDAAKVIPGDEVIYTIYYTVIGKETVQDIKIENPIPEHMMYKEGTAIGEGTEITYSIDNGETFDSPENLKVKNTEGIEKAAHAGDYTNIRWLLKNQVEPGQTGYVVFRAQLE